MAKKTDKKKNVDKIKYISKSGLIKERGWTQTIITSLAGNPDKLVDNPHYKKAAPMCLYDLDRIEKIEATEVFKSQIKKSEGRKISAKKAVGTKCDSLFRIVAAWNIAVPDIPLEKVYRRAIKSFNQWQYDKQWRYESYDGSGEQASINSDPAFLARIAVNYIRHELTGYDQQLECLFGKTGKAGGYMILNHKIYHAIADKWPALREESERQFVNKELSSESPLRLQFSDNLKTIFRNNSDSPVNPECR